METRKILTLIHQLVYYYKEKDLKNPDVFMSNKTVYISYLNYDYIFKNLFIDDSDNVYAILGFDGGTIKVNINNLDDIGLNEIYHIVFVNLMKIIKP